MSIALLTAALSAGGSFLSSMGAGQASAKQGRLQMIEDNMNRLRNDEKLAEVNAKRERLGRELLTIEETTEIEQHNSSWVDVPAMLAAADAAGFNPVTFLNAGALGAYTQGHSYNRTTRTGHNAADAFKMMLPEYALSQASQVPQQPSMLSALGGALTAGTNAFGQQYRADQSYDANMARVLASTAMRGMGLSDGNGFSMTSGGGTSPIALAAAAGLSGGSRAPGDGNASEKLTDLPYPQNWKPGDVDATNIFRNLFIDSSAPNAEQASDRYGDLWEEIFGSANMVQDAYRNVTGEQTRYTGTRLGINIGDFRQPTDRSLQPAFGRWWYSPESLPGKVRSLSDNLPAVNGPRAAPWLPSNPFSGYIGY